VRSARASASDGWVDGHGLDETVVSLTVMAERERSTIKQVNGVTPSGSGVPDGIASCAITNRGV
jgi:hypothetical protein